MNLYLVTTFQFMLFFKVFDNELTINKIAYVTNQLYSFYGKDDSKNMGWSNEDSKWISDNAWLGRNFSLDKNGYITKNDMAYTVALSYYEDEGFEMNILLISNLL